MNEVSQPSFWDYYRLNFRLHLVFFLMSLAVIVCSFVMTSRGQTSVRLPGIRIDMPETCASKRLWGVDCPGCGLTRSFISMSHVQFSRAIQFNAAGPIVYLFVLAQIPWHAFQMMRLWRLKRPVESFWLFVPLYGVSVLVLGQWLWRLFRGELF